MVRPRELRREPQRLPMHVVAQRVELRQRHHALGFESGLLLMTLPILVWWTGMSWIEALVADIGLAITYTVYALLFNLGYDRLFPIAQAIPPAAEQARAGRAGGLAAER